MSGNPSNPSPGVPWFAWALTGSVLRLVAAAVVPVLPEEAYHWCYTNHLSAGFYDHPPMIAWMIALGRLAFGDTALGIRIVPALGSLGTSLALGSLSRRLHGEDAARWTSLLFALEPAAFVGSAFGFPDAPLLLFCSLASLFVAMARQSGRGAWWLAAGAAWGAALLSKYTAGFLPAVLFLYLLLAAPDRRWLKTPWPYLAVLVGIAVFSPVLYWNETHHWASFRFQAVHRFEEMEGPRVSGGLKFLAGQWGAGLPLTLPLAIAATAAAIRRRTPDDLFLLCLSLPLLLFFFVIGFSRASHVFWPLPAYLALLPLMGETAARGSGRIAGAYRACRGWLAGVSAAALLVGAIHFVHPFPGVPALRGVYDWEGITERAMALRSELADDSFVLGVGKRYLCAAQLAFHLHSADRVQAKNLLGEDGLQFAYWAHPESLRHHDAVVVADEGWSNLEAILRTRFKNVERKGDWTVLARPGPRQERYVFYLAKGYTPP
jgi:dolichol-phosphate mannosyltransferase